MRAVDTNVLVRLMLGNASDRQFKIASQVFEKDAWVSHLVLAETVWVLSRVYAYPKAVLIAGIEVLLNHERITLEDQAVVASALDGYREKPSIGFSDCLIFEVSKKAGHLPLYTFDKKLGSLEGTVKL